jgi:D-alanine-D-alanine ligase
MDKEIAKRLLRDAGFDVGQFVVLRRGRRWSAVDLHFLGLPVFVKPARAGSSLGITKVTDWADLDDAVATALDHDEKVIVEAAVSGREIECGVLEDETGAPMASLPAEIRVVRGHEWYDFEAKYLDDACEFDIPAQLPADVTAQVREIACTVFDVLDCAGLARVDFFVRPDGTVVVNEVNTMPGFTPISMYPQMWAATGVDYPALLDRLVQSALRRGVR